eukprot:7378323-Prymnesium_polylepis.1
MAFVFGALAYYVERLDPSSNGLLDSLGTSIWFSVVTFSTVGYGDAYPSTSGGRLVTIMSILCGA